MELILLSCLLVLLGVVYMRHKKQYSYWKERNIKSLPVLPIVGSYKRIFITKIHLAEEMRNVYEKYSNEKYIGAFQGSTPELILRDPEVIKIIISKDFNYFMNRFREHVSDDETLTQHLFHLPGEKWRVLRQKMTSTFTSSKMKKMFHLIVECGELLETSIKEKLLDGNDIDVRELNAKYTTDTIGMCAFGLQMNSFKDENSPFRKMGKMFFETSKLLSFYRFLGGMFPGLFKLLKLKTHVNEDQIEKFFLDLVKNLINSRSGVPQKHDFVDLMIELRNKGYVEMENTEDSTNNKLEITDKLITAQLFVFFVAGFETSSTTMTYALRELALNPGIQKKLQEEIDTVLKKHGGGLTYDSVQEMDYLDMVIAETLRKYPALPFLNRICSTSYKIPNTDVVIDKGVKILIPIYGIQNDPVYFSKPEKFKPERFSKENGDKYHPFSYIPFGEGPRNCIGLRFGKLQTATGLISFLRKYSVETCSETPIELKFDPNAIILSSIEGITLRIKPRT